MKNIIYILLGIVLFTSCQKDEEEEIKPIQNDYYYISKEIVYIENVGTIYNYFGDTLCSSLVVNYKIQNNQILNIINRNTNCTYTCNKSEIDTLYKYYFVTLNMDNLTLTKIRKENVGIIDSVQYILKQSTYNLDFLNCP
jgi:hypothetical protein